MGLDVLEDVEMSSSMWVWLVGLAGGLAAWTLWVRLTELLLMLLLLLLGALWSLLLQVLLMHVAGGPTIRCIDGLTLSRSHDVHLGVLVSCGVGVGELYWKGSSDRMYTPRSADLLRCWCRRAALGG